MDAVETVRIKLAKRQVTAQAQTFIYAAHASAGSKLADIMNAGAEAVAAQREGMTPAARNLVLFQYENLFPGLSQRQRGRETAGPGADNNYIRVMSHYAPTCPNIGQRMRCTMSQNGSGVFGANRKFCVGIRPSDVRPETVT